MEMAKELTAEEASQLQQAVNQLERNYHKTDPNNFKMISAIRQAIANQQISYEDLALSEEAFEMIISEIKQLTLDLCNVFIVDRDNNPADLFRPCNKDESPLQENERFFILQALRNRIITFEEVITSFREYDFNREAKQVVDSFLESEHKELPEETEIKQNGFCGFLSEYEEPPEETMDFAVSFSNYS